MYTVVSWFTDGYSPLNERLRASLDALDIPHREYLMPDKGSWFANVLQKADVLRAAFADCGTDIVYTDSDSLFRKRPALFDEWGGEHVGFHYLPRRGKGELLGGTQYWRNDPLVHELIEQMDTLMQAEHRSSQTVLAEIVPQWEYERGLRVCQLPPEYCCIFDTTRAAYPGIDPVVEHFQHSRIARRG